MRYLLLICLIFGCDDIENGMYAYIKNNTESVKEISDGDYRVEILSQTAGYRRRDLLQDTAHVTRFVHETTVPDDKSFYHVVVYLPIDVGWHTISGMLGGNEPNAFTLIPLSGYPNNIYIIYNPEYWDTASDYRLLHTYIHELMHHVSLAIYGDADTSHKRNEFWGRDGLVNQLTDQYLQETE